MQQTQDSRVITAETQASPPSNRLPRAARTTSIQGASALAFGTPFVIAGLGTAWFALAFYLRGTLNDFDGLRLSFLILFGGMCLLGGLFFVTHGIRDLRGALRKRRFSAEEPTKPWLGDYVWRLEGSKFSGLRETSKLLTTAMIGSLILAPFIWVALRNPFAWAFDLFVGILAVIPGYAWWRWLVAAFAALRFGSSFLKYETFPFFLGSALDARLFVARNLSSMHPLTLTLRCVQEKYMSVGGSRRWGGSVATRYTDSYELFSKTVALNQAQIAALNGDGIPVQFSVPADMPSTQLSNRPPTYWEIEAADPTHLPPYRSVFLVPIYSTVGR